MHRWTATAGFLLAAAVALGAFGAHGLQDKLSSYHLGIFEKATFYHFIHAIGILLVSLLVPGKLLAERRAVWICWLLLFGIVFFCGSLYALAISGVSWLGAITPIGGTAFIVAWVMVGYFSLERK